MNDTTVYSRRARFLFSTILLVFFVSCAKQKQHDESVMDFDRLKGKAASYTAEKKTSDAIRVLALMITRFPDHKEVSEYRLKLADLYYEHGDYDLADEQYKKYLTVNPSKGEYASYRSILSKFNQTLTIDRDPTPVNKTIKRCKQHLENPIYTQGSFRQDVKDILYTCERKLIDREIYTFNFYLQRGKIQSAEHRLVDIEKYLKIHKDLEPRILYLKARLALGKEDAKVAQEQVSLLVGKFPQSLYAEMAARLTIPSPTQGSTQKDGKKAEERFLF